MNNVTDQYQNMPEKVAAINQSGFATWSDDGGLSPQFKQKFDAERIPVRGVRHVRIWGLQVDDERELLGHERTSIDDEDLWEIILEAKDGSQCEVNSKFVIAARDS